MGRRKKAQGEQGRNNYIIPDVPQSQKDKTSILAELPRGSRVYVQEEGGKMRYRETAEVRDSDTIIYKKSTGTPVIMRGRPGRLSEERIKLEAANAETAEVNRQREESIAGDPLVKAARVNSDSPDVLQETVVRLTEAAAALRFEREEAQRKGEATSMIVRREVAALVAVRDASLKRIDQRLRKQEIDLESLAFRNLFVFLVHTFTQAMDQAGVPANDVDAVVALLSKEVDTEEWRNSATKSIQGGLSVVH